MKGLAQILDSFGRSTGEYWSRDNAQFEATNPSLLDRAARTVNPMTGFGASLGALHDAAAQGFPIVDTGVALLQALPLFGTTKAVQLAGQGAVKGSKVITPDLLKTLLSIGAATGTSVAADTLQSPTQSNSPQSKEVK